ncbi:acyltransferase [Mucilaginibacter hurinus]|uniref:Acyltransferase n=1 Tax=Mucilaginibacter hurinus TaxID=2201324 RepID=A0A367GJL4_9SPHI|nr:acyltransferase [Mucilaginibacter hurinus]RCH53667.1 acyltransferase [Mucilaginibacter hurinus]
MGAEKSAAETLKSKPHFEILDGLRGVAAVGVVVFHFMEMVQPDYSKMFIGHGYLAVDFFFCLSGFVIAYAYDNRIKDMSLWKFFESRLIRLHPLVVFGSVLGLLTFLINPFADAATAYSAGKLAAIFVCSVLMIPYPVMPEVFFNNFSFNAPAWSLFWEYVANIIYALVLHRLSRSILFILAIIAAAGIVIVAYRAGNLAGGWGGPNFWDGGVRIAYTFLAGMLVHRSGFVIKNKLGFAALAALLVITLVMPYNTDWNKLAEPLVVIIYFPLLVALGAGTVLTPAVKNLCIFSGKISYPLYMTHYAVMWIFLNYYTTHKPGTALVSVIVIAGVLLLIGFAWLVTIVYDTPIRTYLNNKRSRN